MPREFNVDAERNHFALPDYTRQHIQALMIDLDVPAREVVIRAVAELYQREITDERDVLAEIDDLRTRIARLEQP